MSDILPSQPGPSCEGKEGNKPFDTLLVPEPSQKGGTTPKKKRKKKALQPRHYAVTAAVGILVASVDPDFEPSPDVESPEPLEQSAPSRGVVIKSQEESSYESDPLSNPNPLNGRSSPSTSPRRRWTRLSFAETRVVKEADEAEGAKEENFREVVVGHPELNQGESNFLKTSHYTLLSFLPLNLFEQFHQVSNCYFFLNMVIALIPGVSPITPITAVLPLILVLTVAACKDGYEDWKRHRADRLDNSSVVTILRDKEWVQVKSMEVRVGDIIRMERGDAVKADVVVLASEDPDGVVYIETSQLDGETNVKPRKSRPETATLVSIDEIEAFRNKKCNIHVDLPNDKMYRWQGVMHIEGQPLPLTLKQTLWRGSSMRKTKWCYVTVIYTGHETKQGMNLKKKGRKMSSLLKKLNWLIVLIFGIKHVFIFLLSGLSVYWAAEEGDGHWYLQYWIDRFNGVDRFWLNYLTYFILFSFLIPISLFVTIELCKACQILLMGWDQEMMYWMPNPKLDKGGSWITCRPKTSDLNEQLAVVQYIFSDKTGTLTENIMRYIQGVVCSDSCSGNGTERGKTWLRHEEVTKGTQRQGSINLSAAEGSDDAVTVFARSCGNIASSQHGMRSCTARFLACLALCHTVVPFKNEGGNDYTFEGASPDEVALVSCARDNGFTLIRRTSKEIEIMVGGTVFTFEILDELEFSPTRKMMSIVLRDQTNNHVFLLCKGADSSVLNRLRRSADPSPPGLPPIPSELSPSDNEYVAKLLVEYASQGLRTLCMAWRPLDQVTYDAWRVKYSEVQCSMEKTDEMVDDVCLQLEKDLRLVGVAAYEDKLQDGVGETIRFFVDAGVVVWMLTGDKLETGVEIGKNCGLADRATIVAVDMGKELQEIEKDLTVSLEASHSAQRRKKQEEFVKSKMIDALDMTTKGGRVTLAIDGLALDVAMESCVETFLELSRRIYSAICCRLTPGQKGKIVDLFQKHSGATALAIGDGANDATMIGAACVGVGIIGLEGSQAELASDYAIPRFRHLKRLVAVHGRYALYRNASCVCFSFYKNFVLTMSQVFFAFYSGFSGRTVYDSWLLAVKNTVFTSLPPLLMGCFEKDISEEVLLDPKAGPQLYRQLSQGLYFDTRTITTWFTIAFIHGSLIFWLSLTTLELEDTDVYDGKTSGLYTTGTILMASVVYCVCAKAAIHIRDMTSIQVGGIVFSMVLYPAWLALYSAIPDLWGETHFYRLSWYLFSDPKLYLYAFFFSVGVVGSLDFSLLALQRWQNPTLRDLWQELYPYKPRKTVNPICGCCGHSPSDIAVQDAEIAQPPAPTAAFANSYEA